MLVKTLVVSRLAGALLPGWVATVTASPARSMKVIVAGSLPPRARDERAKSMHGLVPVVLVFSSAPMPAEDPSGRGMLQLVLPLLSWIGSPIAPVVGLRASQL